MDNTENKEIGLVMSGMRGQMRSWEILFDGRRKLESEFYASFLAFIEQLRGEEDRYPPAKQQELLVEAFDLYVRWYKIFYSVNAGGIWFNHLCNSIAAKKLIERLQEFHKDGESCTCPFITREWGAYPHAPCAICGKEK